VSSSFDAKSWLSSFADVVGGKVATPRGQKSTAVANMKAIVLKEPQILDEAFLAAFEFANNSPSLSCSEIRPV
jgi:hypothetical protein